MHRPILRGALLTATALTLALAAPGPARADDDARLSAIEKQIGALQDELRRVKHDLAARNHEIAATKAQAAQAEAAAAHATATPPAMLAPLSPSIPAGYALVPATPGLTPGTVVLAKTEPEGSNLPPGSWKLRGVTVTLGGFIEAAGIYRSRNEVADVASNFNTGIPLPNSQLYHEGETRFSARQSRISLLAQADPDPATHIAAYFETDFLGAAPTANSNESNSYNLRIRHAYAQYDRSDWGFHLLGGQEWSLLTMNQVGIEPRHENIPLTIDAQYVPGFNWARQPQFRIAEDFDDHRYWLAMSVENPQTVYYTGPNGLAPKSTGTLNIVNPGGSLFAPTNNYSDEIAPDVIVKGTADPGFGHFEVYGLARFLHDRVSQPGTGTSNTVLAGGGGAGMILPVVPKLLEFQGSVLAGDGIGRYGSAQLPDAVVGRDGSPNPLPEVEALVGLTGHSTPHVDLYTYAGTEQISRKYFTDSGKSYGYGSPLYSNTDCGTELGASSGCVGNTSGIWQITAGGWWKFLKSDKNSPANFGTMQVGMQYSYTHRSVFQGLGPTPKTDDNIIMVSFRYYPFQ